MNVLNMIFFNYKIFFFFFNLYRQKNFQNFLEAQKFSIFLEELSL